MRFHGGIVAALLVGTALLSRLTFAGTVTACVPQSEMQVLAQHFSQFSALGNAQFCYDGSQTSNLIQALEFLRNNPFAPSMPASHDELFSGSFAKDWWGYFTGRIDTLSVQSSCSPGVGAFVQGAGTSTMYICPTLLTEAFAAVDRASVMMHEARHIDGFAHITCDRGPRAGLGGACDDKISDKGSYAVTVETYAQLGAYASDIHPALNAYAAASAVIYGDEAFEQPIRIDRKEQLTLMTNAKEFYRLNADGSTQLQHLGSASALGTIAMRAQFMILIPDDRTLPAKYLFSNNEGDVQQQPGDLAIQYNAQTPQQRANLLTFHIGSEWRAQVYHDHVTLECSPPDTQDLQLNGLTAAAVIYPDGYVREKPSALLLTTTGAILEFGCNSDQPYVQASPRTLDQHYKRIYKVGNEVIGLSGDGHLFALNGTSSKAFVTAVDGQIYDIAPSETYVFFAAAPY